MKKIQVTKTFLPHINEYNYYLEKIYKSHWVTNFGQLVEKLENRLKKYLGVKYLVLTANGTLALQVAYRLLELNGDVITTPFSFVATASSLIWEKLNPLFADIDPYSFTINPEEIEKKITDKTTGIVPVHVYGNCCNIEEINSIAEQNNLKVIYDAAHAFGVKYKNKSILTYGNASVLSFHATKLFHTIEGGAIIINDYELYERAKRMINFGYENYKIHCLGINAKMNEFEAAMGLAILDNIDDIFAKRKEIFQTYYKNLSEKVFFPEINKNITWNFSYVPVIFPKESILLKVVKKLNEHNIFPRRYFNPSLDTLDYLPVKQHCKVSRDISSRVLCLPNFYDLEHETLEKIISIIKQEV
jgi:dTDP-4-amino-4,6-dideoxygalactose transaminase